MANSGQTAVPIVEQLRHGTLIDRHPVAERLVFGRSDECDVILGSRRVSRQHAELRRDSSHRFVLEDLGSSNGTFVNGRQISRPAPLAFGDEFEIGDCQFRFLDLAPPSLVEDPTSISHRLSGRGTAHPSASRLQAIISVAQSISRSLTPNALFEDVLRAIMGVFRKANRAFILTPDEAGVLQIRSRLAQSEDDTFLARAPVSRFVAEQVMTSGEAMLSLNAPDDPKLDPSVSIRELKIASLMCAPIPTSDGTPQGVVYIDSFARGPMFDESALELLATIATIVGQFVENSKLHETRLRAELLEREMQLAHDIQLMLVPQEEPTLPGYSLAHEYQPAGALSGDYVDFSLADGRLALAIGDVSGKGAPAALMMARMHAAVRLVLQDCSHLADAVGRLDRVLAESNEAGMFVTFALAVIDPQAHEIEVVDAGHLPPLYRHNGTTTECFPGQNKGIVLGIGGEHVFPARRMSLSAGDSLVLITDGVTEARNADRAIFGTDRLIASITSAPDRADAVRQQILQDVEEFRGPTPASDDLSIVVVRRDD